MRKFILIFMPLCLLLFCSCKVQGKSYDKSVSKNDTVYYGLKEITNSERLQKFLDNIDKDKKDRVNLVISTDEGDPIITQLYFDGKDVIIAVDSSKDKYAGIPGRYEIFYKTISGGSQLKEDLLKYLKDSGFLRM